MKQFLAKLLLGISLLAPATVLAQEATPAPIADTVLPAADTINVTPVITVKSEVEVGKNLILNASNSSIPQALTPSFTWYINGEERERGEEAVVIFDTPGRYTIRLEIQEEEAVFSTETTVFAFADVITFLYNGAPEIFDSNMEALQTLAEQKGVFLNIQNTPRGSSLFVEQPLSSNDASLFQELLLGSTIIVGGPDGTGVLSLISNFKNIAAEGQEKLRSIPVLLSTQESLWLQSRVLERMKGRLVPENFIVVKRDPFSLLNLYLQSDNLESFVPRIPAEEVARLTPSAIQDSFLFPLSSLLTDGITAGIPSEVLLFILFLPFLMTISVFLKQMIGVETVGVFQTIVLTLSFLVLGITLGTLTFLFTLVIGMIGRVLLQKAHVLYVARISLVLSLAAIGLFVALVVGAQNGYQFGLEGTGGTAALLGIFPMILIAIQADRLSVLVVKRRDLREDLIRLISTYLAVVVGYLIIKVDILELTLLAIPELVLIAFIVQYAIGRYAGLRVVEYLRFRELFKHELEE